MIHATVNHTTETRLRITLQQGHFIPQMCLSLDNLFVIHTSENMNTSPSAVCVVLVFAERRCPHQIGQQNCLMC